MFRLPEDKEEPAMKIIRVNTDNSVDTLEYPKGTIREELEALRKMIGPKCELVEHVRPERLYTELKASQRISHELGSGVSMLVDEEGSYHDLPYNLFASWLYKSEEYSSPIFGNILLIGEYDTGDGYSFCGLSEKEYDSLLPQVFGMAFICDVAQELS